MLHDDICKWVSGLPNWQKIMASQILNEHELNIEFFDKVYEIFLCEKDLLNTQIETKVMLLPKTKNKEEVSKKYRWTGVSDIRGVNALKNDESLAIGKEMTLIYGENGSGKSGYARLFCNAFISRGDKSLIPNVHSKERENVYAQINFESNEEQIYLKYPEDKHNGLFYGITVFDTMSAIRDMIDESELSFVPSEFSFFDKFLFGCKEIQSRLKNDLTKHPTDNELIIFFDEESDIKSMIKSLSKDTNLSELRKSIFISDSDIEQNKKDKERKAQLISLDIDTQVIRLNNIESALEKKIRSIKQINDLYSKEKLDHLCSIINELQGTKELLNTNGISQFKDEQIAKLGSSEWKNFINAARDYYAVLEVVNNCIFCGQDINGIQVIDKYWAYLNSSAEKNITKLNQVIAKLRREYSEQSFVFCDEGSLLQEWFQLNYLEQYSSISMRLRELKLIADSIIDNLDRVNWNESIDEQKIEVNMFDIVKKKLNDDKMSLDIEAVGKELRELQFRNMLFTHKEKANTLLSDIEKLINNMSWTYKANKNAIRTGPVSVKQKELFGKYITSDYINSFDEECRKLDADFKAEITQRGFDGTTLKKLSIKGNSPAKILSEGEQRAIALANILAEINCDSNNIAIIFDDPVSSLDHKRRSKIAKRLVDETQKRQVIILTHDISFLMEIKTLCEKDSVNLEMSTIRKIHNTPGNISASIPWVGMNVSDRKKELNRKLVKIEKLEKDGEVDEYYEKTKIWCELLRESWERSVEEILFNDAIQRYNPTVQTQRLKRAPFTPEIYKELECAMGECSSWLHDRARELNTEIPTTIELRKYITDFSDFIKKYRT